MKVINMINPSTGKPLANQLIITTKNGEYFQSYKTVIAKKPIGWPSYPTNNPNQKIELESGENHPYSWCRDLKNDKPIPTTMKYLLRFLGDDSKKTIQAKIDSGEYKLADLNR